jgi:hypothetical protein
MSLGAPGLDAIEPCGDHHMTLMSALSTVVLAISSGAVFGILAARFGSFSWLFLVHGDTHIHPPAWAILP